jgi:hypothetical protein
VSLGKVTGDFAGLERVTKKLRKKSVGVVTQIARDSAKAIKPVLAAHLAAGATPYGDAWQPKKDGGRALAGAFAKVRAKGKSIRASAPYPYVFHNVRTKHNVQRQIVPDDARGIPADWIPALEAAAAKQLEVTS